MVCDPCTVGVVLDGPWERNDEVRGIFEREVLDLAAEDFDVQFPPEKRFVADFSLGGVAAAVDSLINDPDVDLVLTSGPVASTYAARLVVFPKPLVAVFVIDPEVQGIPTAANDDGERVSGVTNLNYVTFPSDLERNVRRLREITPFRRMTLLTSEGLVEAVPELEANLLAGVQGLDLEPSMVRVGSSVEAAIEAIPRDAEAVYVFPLIQLPPGDLDRLAQALIDRRVPAFSYWGRSEVERGLLASLFASEAFDRLGRRIALNVQRILLGEDAGSLPVDFERRTRLSLNVETARAIGVYPSWSIWTEVEIIGDREQGFERQLSLSMAAREAVTANLELLATNRFVAAGDQERRIARSALRPQISVAGFGEVIDSDRAASLSGGPQRLGVASASVSQLLYADGARANVQIQDELQLSREQQLEETRLDIVLDAAAAYLDVLRAKTFEDIQRENLSVTRSNLELAQVRQEIGVARPAEVIRWDNQIANNRRGVIDASAQRNVAEIRLNRLLNRPLEEPFQTEETDLDDPVLRTSAAQLGPYLGNPFAFDIFRDFMTTEALAVAPELQQIDAAVRAQERALTAAGRAFWAPTVSFNGELAAVETGGAGTSFDFGVPLPFELGAAGNVNWTASVTASLPVFTGGARRAERAQTSEELAELRLTRRSVAQQVEQRARSTLHAAGASFAGIELAEASADAADRSLVLVTDAYQQGAASILDLLDAQNQALVAGQVAANAVFDYLIDLMNVQRAVGRFDFFLSPDEHRAFLERLGRFFVAAGFDPVG
jgi:outer membrane protein TolC/ABC-type uncharacterized transport system substrate-binding protein